MDGAGRLRICSRALHSAMPAESSNLPGTTAPVRGQAELL